MQLANIGTRFIALFIDGFILALVGNIIFRSGEASTLASVVLGIAYQWYFLTRHKGKTPGKMAMNIRVIRTDGRPLSDADAILRYFGYLLNSFLLMIGWIWAIFDDKNQGFHDKIAKTYVVRA